MKAPQVAHVEEVTTSSETTEQSDCSKPVAEHPRQTKSDEVHSTAESPGPLSTTVPTSQHSAMNADISSGSADTACSKPQSTTTDNDAASLTTPSSSDSKPDTSSTDDDNPELTVLVETTTLMSIFLQILMHSENLNFFDIVNNTLLCGMFYNINCVIASS